MNTIYVLCKLYDKASAHHIVAYLSCQLVWYSTMPTMISWSTRLLRTIFPHSLQIPTLSRKTLVVGFLLVANVLPCHHFLTMISIIWTRISDIVLAFPPLSTTAHPDYSVHTHQFAGNNTHFLNTFFNALHKMSTLGVNTSLLSPAIVLNARICAIQPEQGSSKLHITLVCFSALLFKMLF